MILLSTLIAAVVSVDTSVEPVDALVKDKRIPWTILADGEGFDGPNPTAYHVQAQQLEATLLEALAARGPGLN